MLNRLGPQRSIARRNFVATDLSSATLAGGDLTMGGLTRGHACPSTGRVETYARPMPANARAILIEAFRDAHRWLDVLVAPHVPSLWKSEGDGGA